MISRRKFPTEVGFQDDLYVTSETNYEHEFFKEFDGRARDVLEKVKRHASISLAEKRTLATFVLLANLRTPEVVSDLRDRLQSEVAKGIPELEEWFTSVAPRRARSTFSEFIVKSEIDISDVNLGSIIDSVINGKALDFFLSLTYEVIIMGEGLDEVVTCDRPVVVEEAGRPDLEVWFPLGPHKILIARRHEGGARWTRARLTPAFRKELNRRLVSQSANYVFATSDKLSFFVSKHMSAKVPTGPAPW